MSRAVLSAPVTFEGGTLHAEEAILLKAGCTALFGKSGTTDSTEPNDFRDKLAIIGARCGDRNLLAFVQAGSPLITIPVGYVTSAALAKLAANAITTTLRTGN